MPQRHGGVIFNPKAREVAPQHSIGYLRVQVGGKLTWLLTKLVIYMLSGAMKYTEFHQALL
ncbi:MAG: hypothetical protein ACREOI_29260 [bacterium]